MQIKLWKNIISIMIYQTIINNNNFNISKDKNHRKISQHISKEKFCDKL